MEAVLNGTSQSILEAALALPEPERAELVARVADSIGEGEAESDIDAAWLAEAKRRLERVRSGRATLIATEEVELELEQLLDASKTRRVG